MKPDHKSLFLGAVPCAAFMLVLSASNGFAQGRTPQPHGPPAPEKPDLSPRPASIRERQLIMDELSREAGSGPPPRKSEELRMAEISEDYRELQQVNNRMMASIMRAPEPDFGLIVKSVSDIRRRAERMRQNLALPALEGKAKPEPKQVEDAAGMRAALLVLDRSIMSFVRSPLFKNTDVLDADAATKASRDLAEVIEVSGRVVKDAERLSKKAKN